ncbi:serine/threonine-protein kinase [uncultured Leifsonia sp.]|uniref:serine/threonine-protein kinase n=1 Tax=uncultured Leifsonia sp. TaxID=340359 RepID=UPI0025E65AF9|nr:serine/threonine-protein kinase [uncultured Leifsonia sp.]
MARRLPSQPPNLPGFSYVRVLGSGGFADVFLYEQNMPRRQVAVKVMLAEVVTSQVKQMFQAEANLMAQLSTHPSILTVYQASVSADGRPYLVMELCSSAIGQRYRMDPLPVPEVLSIGVRIASAVETAHRAGVLHRDIKPSNILTTAYGHPVLSDFGIAATLSEADVTEAIGLSIPWSAPEVLLDETSGTIASEVWSIGATVYSLLAGRSPFEVPGKENTSAELIQRITKGRPQPIGRADVPARLEQILMRSMSRKPSSRQRSVLELIRELQSVEAELGLPQTPIEVAMDDWALATADDPEERTRVKGVVAVDPGARRRRRKPSAASAATSRTPTRTMVRESVGSSPSAPPPAPSRVSRALVLSLVACALLVVVLAVTAGVVLVRAGASNDIPTVRDLSGRVSAGTIVFTWSDPGIESTDSYQVTVDDQPPSSQRATEFRVDAKPGQTVCVTVTVNRDGKTGSPSGQKCVQRTASP